MHLRVDCLGHVGNKKLLLDPKRLKKALCELADVAKMHAFGEPQVMECPFPYPEGGIALSAVLFLGESAITVHTWPENGYAAVDVFTCGENCEPELACEFLVRFLGATRYTLRDIPRGQRQANERVPLERTAIVEDARLCPAHS